MTSNIPIHRLKREARALARQQAMPLHQALTRIARREGFHSWSLLVARRAKSDLAEDLLAQLDAADLLLLGARPGQGKTRLSLQLLITAMRAGWRGAFFSLEYTHQEVRQLFSKLGEDASAFGSRLIIDDADAISAAYIIRRLAHAPRYTLVVIDYLQILDQRREHPPLQEQVRALKDFAARRGLIMVFIAQIHRSYDADRRAYPGLRDVRLPNPLQLSLFDKACFLSRGGAELAAPG